MQRHHHHFSCSARLFSRRRRRSFVGNAVLIWMTCWMVCGSSPRSSGSSSSSFYVASFYMPLSSPSFHKQPLPTRQASLPLLILTQRQKQQQQQQQRPPNRREISSVRLYAKNDDQKKDLQEESSSDDDNTNTNDEQQDDNASVEKKSSSRSKQDLIRAVGESMRQQKDPSKSKNKKKGSSDDNSNKETSEKSLDNLNPFKAGQKLRQTIDQAVKSVSTSRQSTTKDLYLNEQLLDTTTAAAASFAERWAALSSSSSSSSADSLELLQQDDDDDDYVPEVLVVGATGAVGRKIVQRLLRGNAAVGGGGGGRGRTQQQTKVRVLVRDLYTRTLNALGTGVTYCQGDLNNADSLEYACTDVDKIIFCAGAPRPDEDGFRNKFGEFVQEMLPAEEADAKGSAAALADDDDESLHTTSAPPPIIPKVDYMDDNVAWEQLDSVLQVRAQLAEQVDCVGMKNLVQAYQHVRHADYGTSQAAKRTLFKFSGTSRGGSSMDDFNLFAIDSSSSRSSSGSGSADEDDNDMTDDDVDEVTRGLLGDANSNYNDYSYADDDYDEYDEDFDDDDVYSTYGQDTSTDTGRNGGSESNSVQTQVQWMRNKFGHGVFVGRIPKVSADAVGGGGGGGGGAEATLLSTRFRARDDPDTGIDLSGSASSSTSAGFAGFVARVCSDGGTYEAIVRTGGGNGGGMIEYVCEFSTFTKPVGSGSASGDVKFNKSRNKFITVRLPFENFKPRRFTDPNLDASALPPFRGKDVRFIGFSYRSASNELKAKLEPGDLTNFYLAFSYIKLYRAQPEPEFVYVSDARIPPVVRSSMVRHQQRKLVLSKGGKENDEVRLLDDATLLTATQDEGRTDEEVYYKYRGEEILKSSGLSYAIVRVGQYNELPSGEASTVTLFAADYAEAKNLAAAPQVQAVSRDEVAQVCVHALLDPNALNKSFYVSKKVGGEKVTSFDEDMANKFKDLPADVVA